MAGIVTALLSGALMSVQGVFNTGVTKQTSVWVASGWSGNSLDCLCCYMVFTGRPPVQDSFRFLPYLLSGGIIGAVITYTVIRSMQSLGPAQTALLIVVAQIITAYVIQLFGWFGTEKMPFEWHKLLGAAVAVAGIIIFQR